MSKLVEDLDIYRTANVLIKKHGSGALRFAAQRAEEILEYGDEDGAATWRRICEAIEQLNRQRGRGDLLN